MSVVVRRCGLAVTIWLVWTTVAHADPCGMVPPIYAGEDVPITRIGRQKTYVFYKNGIETFVIRPAFRGNVAEFGMLIPFPAVPEIRKVADDVFSQIAAAIDPPEVVVDVRPLPPSAVSEGAAPMAAAVDDEAPLSVDAVRVLKEEAVGMYEVAVLQAGSAAALNRWMDDHGYVYPQGMDEACNEYVAQGWCFVAVKTRVGAKSSVDPAPGRRTAEPAFPDGGVFDGNVQAMGFRFRVDELVVPMRLSSFNAGELHNVVYLLTDGPRRVESISEALVVRQVPGEELYRNVTAPLPLRIIGGTIDDIPDWRRESLQQERDPEPHNGVARDLFGSDLLAVREDRLSHPHEETEKMLLRIGERMGLRGEDVDGLHDEALKAERRRVGDAALADLKTMTLTVVDGDFPRDVLAAENLTFTSFEMDAGRNTPGVYDARLFAPAPQRSGKLEGDRIERIETTDQDGGKVIIERKAAWRFGVLEWSLVGAAALALIAAMMFVLRQKPGGGRSTKA